MHPYPAPEQDPRFWNRSWTVTNSGDTQQITMLNMSSWAVYLKMTYGTNIHIILNETGVSSTYNKVEMLNEQAAAVALTYYLIEFDKNLDTMDYHRNIDDPGETNTGWHLGLYYKPAYGWDYSRPKPSANVFRYMDSASWDSATSRYAPITGRASWREGVRTSKRSISRNKLVFFDMLPSVFSEACFNVCTSLIFPSSHLL